MVLEDQVEQQTAAIERLNTNLNNYKQKYQQASSHAEHLEGMVASLQERITQSGNRVRG